MYQRARKLRDIITDPQTFLTLAEDQLESLSVAINALYLVDEKSAWILMPVIPDPVCRRPYSIMFHNSFPARHVHAKNYPSIYPSLNTSPTNTTLKLYNYLTWSTTPRFFELR